MILIYGLLSGLLLGITGGGGAIVTVPALVYGSGTPISSATTISLLVVAISAALGVALRYKEIVWEKGIIFAIVGGIGSPFGILLANRVSEKFQTISFATLMLIIALIMFYKSLRLSQQNNQTNKHKLTSFLKIIPIALLTGAVTGFLGVGGGFLIVPALVLFAGLGNKIAAATSLLIISLISSFSLIVKSGSVNIDTQITGLFVAGSIIGMLSGSYLVKKISDKNSQQIFALVAMSLGGYMLLSEIIG